MGCTDGLYPTFNFNFTCFKYVKKGAVVVAASMPLTMKDMGEVFVFSAMLPSLYLPNLWGLYI